MIPFIVQNLNAIGQSDDGLIDPSVISKLLAGLQAIGDRLFKTRYPTGWVAGFGRLCPYSHTLEDVGFYRPVQPGDLGGSSLSPFRIQVQLSRIDLLVAPWFPPSLWTRGIFLRFEPPQPGQQGPNQSFAIALYLPKNLPMKPRPSGSSRSEWRFLYSLFAHFSCIKLRSALPDPATKPTENYAFFSFFKGNLRRIINFFERQKNCFFHERSQLFGRLKQREIRGFSPLVGLNLTQLDFPETHGILM